MSLKNFENKIRIAGEMVRKVDPSLSFTMLEIGALPLEGLNEPFHQLLGLFPESRIIAFEVDKELCDDLNRKVKPGIRFHPVALGRREERRPFYQTNHAMCSSLYKPNEKLINMYNNMEVAMLKSVESIETVSLDYFCGNNGVDSVDFIKIDIQGAELDVFQGGENTLKDVLAIVSEVEFFPHYIDQPLFGDVCAFLTGKEFMFQAFMGLSGRGLKPIVLENNPNFPSRHMWTDALFFKDLFKIPALTSSQLLKMGLLAYIYGSPDVTYYCFQHYDEKNGTTIHESLFDIDSQANG